MSDGLPLLRMNEHFSKVPWDSRVFGMDVFELRQVSDETIAAAQKIPGHYTVKVDPLFPKKVLNDAGFYYSDTLIETHCGIGSFRYYGHDLISISQDIRVDDMVALLPGAFRYDRFHRDPEIGDGLADLRYENWLRELHGKGQCFGLLFDGAVAGFLCYDKEKILLHALGRDFRGRGLSKYFWSPACRALFDTGFSEITSSVSAANMAVVNLYASLGFKFRNAVDIYHRLTL